MPRKLREYASIGLLSLLGACASNKSTVDETNKLLANPPNKFTLQKRELPEELELYKRGPVQTENSNGYILSYPIAHRDSAKLTEPVKQLFPECVVLSDLDTNQLVVRVPYSQIDAQNPNKDAKLQEVKRFIGDIDVAPAQYNIHAYIMQISAARLSSVRSSLDFLIESGDVKLALSSLNTNRPQERGITHTITGILSAVLPTFQISALFEGLERHGYVYNLSQVTSTVNDSEPAQVSGTRRVPVPKIFPTAPVPIVGYEYVDVSQNLRVVPRSRKNRAAELEIEIIKGNLLPANQDINNINLYDISSRIMKTKVRVPLGKMLFLATTLEDSRKGTDETSPISPIIGSSSAEEQSRMYEVVAIVATRIDSDKQETGWPTEELERQLNRDGSKKQ